MDEFLAKQNDFIGEQFRALRTEVAFVKEDTQEIKTRLALVEGGIAGLRRDSAHDAATIVAQQVALDRVVRRIEVIERRLGLIEVN